MRQKIIHLHAFPYFHSSLNQCFHDIHKPLFHAIQTNVFTVRSRCTSLKKILHSGICLPNCLSIFPITPLRNFLFDHHIHNAHNRKNRQYPGASWNQYDRIYDNSQQIKCEWRKHIHNATPAIPFLRVAVFCAIRCSFSFCTLQNLVIHCHNFADYFLLNRLKLHLIIFLFNQKIILCRYDPHNHISQHKRQHYSKKSQKICLFFDHTDRRTWYDRCNKRRQKSCYRSYCNIPGVLVV